MPRKELDNLVRVRKLKEEPASPDEIAGLLRSGLARKGVATSEFLRFYFLTEEGLRKIGEASPGGAGRNRTLGLSKLAEIEVPIPDHEKQVWFNRLQAKVGEMRAAQQGAETEPDAMLPSVLDRAFKGEL